MLTPVYFHICGCRGSWPVSGEEYREFGGQTTCYILKHEDRAVVIDCGTGFYQGLTLLQDCSRVDIVLTHIHYDHIMGLFDWFERPQGAEIHFYGNFRKWPPVSDFLRAPYWPYTPELPNIHAVEETGAPMALSTGGQITFFPADHPDNACVPLIEWNGKKIMILQDNGPDLLFAPAVLHDTDLLVYDGMLENSLTERMKSWGHSSWEKGCELANQVRPKFLLITHHSPHIGDTVLLEREKLAKACYPSSAYARAGMTLTL